MRETFPGSKHQRRFFALPLAIAEKVVLAHIHNFPGCSNGRLAKLIGATRRGVENMLRRLREQGYIKQTRKSRLCMQWTRNGMSVRRLREEVTRWSVTGSIGCPNCA